jgi:tRNA threonylcarbamoyladenosine biosynthesis protein TsaE
LPKIISNNAEDTKKLAKKIASRANAGDIFALIGQIGAGKTTFVQGFIKYFKINQHITSPTFVIMNEYQIKDKNSIVHIDLYRLEKIDSEILAQISDYFQNPKNICLIEWAEKLKKQLPLKTKIINFKILGEKSREILYDFNN